MRPMKATLQRRTPKSSECDICPMVRSVHFPGMTLGEMDTYLDDADNLSTYGTYVKVEEDKLYINIYWHAYIYIIDIYI